MSDGNDDVQAGSRGLTYDEAFHRYVRLDTLGELDRLREVLAGNAPAVPGKELLQWLAKIRAHVVADELERKRLQGVIMSDARVPGDEERLFEAITVRHVLELDAAWELAPQRARLAARLMAPTPICGATTGEPGDVCLRTQGHDGDCCPRERCGAGHDEEGE